MADLGAMQQYMNSCFNEQYTDVYRNIAYILFQWYTSYPST